MTEQELRALVRDVIARRGVAGAQPADTSMASAGLSALPAIPVIRHHASHAMFVLPAGADVDGPCIIEPTVACNHCGYCKSYGH